MLIWNTTVKLAETCVPKAMHGWLEDISSLLQREGEELKLVIVSVRDASDVDMEWEVKLKMLVALEKLAQRVKICAGEVVAGDEAKRKLEWRLGEYIDVLNTLRV
jgi:hypothetical protein